MSSYLNSHILQVPQAGPEFVCQVHILTDELDVLLDGLMDKICRETGQTKEELQQELEMVDLEDLDLPSDETTSTAPAEEDEEVSDFFRAAQADPILNREDLLRAPILPPISRPPPSATTTTTTTTITASTTITTTITTTVDDTDLLNFHTSTALDPIVTLPEILSPVLRPVARPRRGRFHRDFNRRRARAREQQRERQLEQEQQRQLEDDDEEGEEGRRVIRVRLPGQWQHQQQQDQKNQQEEEAEEAEEEGEDDGRTIRVRLPGQGRAIRIRRA